MVRIKLISVIGDCDLSYLDSFLSHYLSLWIISEDILLAYHLANHHNLEKSFSIFDTYAIYPKIIFSGEWLHDEGGIKKDKKDFYLQFLMKFVGEYDWVLRADADERHQYEDTLENMIAMCQEWWYDTIIGIWIDRIRRDGALQDIDPFIPLNSQFPLGTVISQELFQKRKKNCYKVMLAKSHIQMQNAWFHSVLWPHSPYPSTQLVSSSF